MRFSIFIALTMSLAACASSNKAAPPPTQPASSPAAQTAPAAQASDKAATAEKETAKVTCTSGKDSRTLRVLTKVKGCELEYTKNGKASVVASSTVSSKHCDDKLASIKDKLVNAGFNCQ
jgi:hypothetical protein